MIPNKAQLLPSRTGLPVFAGYVLVYVLTLGVRPMIIPDEPRYAMIPWEMIHSGDWIAPHLVGLPYFEKPVLGYWLNALFMLLAGENAMGVRLSSALGAGLCALVVGLLARRFFPDRMTAWLAPAVMLTMGLMYVIGTFAVLDTPFTAFVTLGMGAFFLAVRHPAGLTRQALLALFGLACGLAFMTKGFAAFAVPVTAIVPYMLWERRWKELFIHCWTPMLFALLAALPWALAVHFQEPDYWRYFFWVEHVERFLSGEGRHSQPFWFFVPLILVGAMPWTVLFPAAAKAVVRTELTQPLIRFALCWLVFPFVFFSASSGKLGTYILPCLPPLALLTAHGLARSNAADAKWITRGTWFLTALLFLILFVLWGVHLLGPDEIRPYAGNESWKMIPATLVLVVWSAVLISGLRSRIPGRILRGFILGPVLAMAAAPFLFPVQLVGENKAPGDFLARQTRYVEPQAVLFADDYSIHAVAWTYDRPDVNILLGAGELSYGVRAHQREQRKFGLHDFSSLVNDPERKAPVVLVQKKRRWAKYKNAIPGPSYLASNAGFVFQYFAPPDKNRP